MERLLEMKNKHASSSFKKEEANLLNWASWIRTSASRSQSPLPYRLAIAH
jgi:hypothetical protein